MKKKTRNIISNIIAIVLFAFGMLSAWVGKMEYKMLILFAIVSVGLILYKNDGLKEVFIGVVNFVKPKKDA